MKNVKMLIYFFLNAWKKREYEDILSKCKKHYMNFFFSLFFMDSFVFAHLGCKKNKMDEKKNRGRRGKRGGEKKWGREEREREGERIKKYFLEMLNGWSSEMHKAKKTVQVGTVCFCISFSFFFFFFFLIIPFFS